MPSFIGQESNAVGLVIHAGDVTIDDAEAALVFVLIALYGVGVLLLELAQQMAPIGRPLDGPELAL